MFKRPLDLENFNHSKQTHFEFRLHIWLELANGQERDDNMSYAIDRLWLD